MGYVILRFTMPDDVAMPALFSASGERTVASDVRRALASRGAGGLCVAAASASGGESPGVIDGAVGPTAAFDSNGSDNDDPDDAGSIVTDADDMATDDSSAWKSVLLSAEDNFTMSWRFTDDAS